MGRQRRLGANRQQMMVDGGLLAVIGPRFMFRGGPEGPLFLFFGLLPIVR